MRAKLAGVLALLAVPLAVPAAADAGELRAGVGKADITPENGGTTLGFVRPDIMVKGIHTRLMGRALVLDDGDTRVALLSTDLGFALQKDSLVARLKDLGYTHETILYSGTHTHSGPEDLSDWQVEQLARAIRQATANLVPARAAWASQRVMDVNRNRSIEAHLADHGMDLFYGEGDPTDDPKGVEHTRDTRLRLLRVDRTDGRPLAGWIHFPVHLTTSAPDVDIWDTDLGGAAVQHLEEAVHAKGFEAFYTNGALGDQMPRFDSFNRTAIMDLHGRRIALKAAQAWRAAGKHLERNVDVGVRWTRTCFCGQEVDEAGHRIDTKPIWGLAFFGGSEDGASIFHEPAATEGRRLPADAADPVQGRKIQIAPGIVHETVPEIQVIRVGDRLLLDVPGEPSVEMGRRFEATIRPILPAGVKEPVVVGLSNDYMGYLTTPEEYEMQHYEGGHTVFGIYTSLLISNSLVELTRALAEGKPAPEPAEPPELGGTDPGAFPAGDADGAISEQPRPLAERLGAISIAWTGSEKGVDRPVDKPFVVVERLAKGRWRTSATDLGLSFIWREEGGAYRVRWDIPPGEPVGPHRFRIRSAKYDLKSRAFKVGRTTRMRLRGVVTRRARRGRTRLLVVAQNPPPDPDKAVVWRPVTPPGGRAIVRVGKQLVKARWRDRQLAWTAVVRGRVPRGKRVTVVRASDGYGNHLRRRLRVRVGQLAPLVWPDNIGTGDGRTPGPLGQGDFPP